MCGPGECAFTLSFTPHFPQHLECVCRCHALQVDSSCVFYVFAFKQCHVAHSTSFPPLLPSSLPGPSPLPPSSLPGPLPSYPSRLPVFLFLTGVRWHPPPLDRDRPHTTCQRLRPQQASSRAAAPGALHLRPAGRPTQQPHLWASAACAGGAPAVPAVCGPAAEGQGSHQLLHRRVQVGSGSPRGLQCVQFAGAGRGLGLPAFSRTSTGGQLQAQENAVWYRMAPARGPSCQRPLAGWTGEEHKAQGYEGGCVAA
jgi:hypothetical protein